MDQDNASSGFTPFTPAPTNESTQTPPSSSATTPGLPEATKKKSPALFFAVTTSLVVVAFAGIVLFQNSQTARGANVKQNPVSQFTIAPSPAPATPTAQPQEIFPTESANPFETTDNNINPFAEPTGASGDYQNPFK